MTKTFLLAATAITAIAFGGAANAGTITGSKISNVNINDTTTTNALRVFTVASEATDPTTANPLLSTTANTVFNVTSTNPLTIAANTTVSYTVSFTISGAGKFGTIADTNLRLADAAGTAVTTGVTVQNISPGDGLTASFLVTVAGGTGGVTIANYALNGVGISVASEADVFLASEVKQSAGGAFVTVDTTTATKIVQFKAALGSYTATANTVLAGLPSFTAFKAATGTNALTGATNGGLTQQVSGSTTLYRIATTTNGYSIALNTTTTGQVGGGFYRSLFATGTPAILAASDIIDGATATVSGTNLDKLTPTLGTAAAAAGATSASASFTLTASQALSGQLKLEVPTTGAPILTAGTYSASILPTYKSGFTPNPTAAQTVNLLTVSLDGTTFNAPWFVLNNANNGATLRIGNNSSTAATGPVIVQLRANNGTSTTTPMATVAQAIPANGTLEITSAVLVNALGTNAQNGDLLVTVQGDGAVLSAKVRVRNSASGATFEQSLGLLQ